MHACQHFFDGLQNSKTDRQLSWSNEKENPTISVGLGELISKSFLKFESFGFGFTYSNTVVVHHTGN